MSLLKALKGCIGKRCVVVHNEGESTHTIVGTLTDADEDVLTIITDYGVRNILPIKQILKVKEIRDEGVR